MWVWWRNVHRPDQIEKSQNIFTIRDSSDRENIVSLIKKEVNETSLLILNKTVQYFRCRWWKNKDLIKWIPSFHSKVLWRLPLVVRIHLDSLNLYSTLSILIILKQQCTLHIQAISIVLQIKHQSTIKIVQHLTITKQDLNFIKNSIRRRKNWQKMEIYTYGVKPMKGN